MSLFDFLEDPKMQALLAAGAIAATGGAAAPAVAGAAGAGGAAMGPMIPAAGAPLLDAAGMAITPSSGAGMGGLLSGFAEKAKPFTDAARAASSVSGLLGGGQSQPVQGAAPPQTVGSGGLSQLFSQLQSDDASKMELELQRRAKQQETLKRFGGGYGFA